MSGREEPTSEEIQMALEVLKTKLDATLKDKGRGIFVSGHETVGVLAEEVREYETMIFKPPKGSLWGDSEYVKTYYEQRKQELLDIAVTALWGYISEGTGKQDW